jgi:DNA-binding FrmR family transcriptional regulator
MLSDDEKTKLANRLRRVAGQVTGIERMMEEDAYCVEILTQIAAASGALTRVGQIILDSHIKSCVADAMQSGSAKKRDQKLEELIELFRKYSRVSD